jgi:precorrin-8X/cobalt-precorrin-8 methylmutase
MQSGDGLIVRIRPSAGVVSASQARAIAELARTHGNGQIDLTQRANLQIRGVSDATWPDLIVRLRALGLIDDDERAEAARNIVCSPLTGFDRNSKQDAREIVKDIEYAIKTYVGLDQMHSKFSYVVDDGGGMPLDGVSGDVHLLAGPEKIEVSVELSEDVLVVLGYVIPEALSGTLGFIGQFVRFAPIENDDGKPRRMADIVERYSGEYIALQSAFNSSLNGPVHKRIRRRYFPHFGLINRNSKYAYFSVGVPFGRLSSGMLIALADAADRDGVGELRLTPWRSILLPGWRRLEFKCDLLSEQFIKSPADPRLTVAACSGAPECESAAAPVREAALALAPLASGLPGSGVRLHVSGCSKGCARPGSTAVTLVARANRYDLVVNGRAGDAPLSTGHTHSDIESILRSMAATRHVTSPVQIPRSDRASYIRDGAEIYRHSFAIIRAEADLARFSPAEEPVAVRVIHASGMVEIAADIAFAPGAADAARAALQNGAPIFTDAEMVARGVTRARLPANNDVICTLTDPRVPEIAAAAGTTRSAAAMELWRDRLGGAIVAIGNAPTSLYRLLEMLDEGAPLPACVIGMPVGFVGAAESKDALILDGRVPYIVVRGRKGGSAMAAATVNALASDRE